MRESRGSSVVLPCPLSSRNMVVWVKGQRVLYAGDLRVVQDPRLRVEGTSLVVEEEEEEDSGVFRCQVEEEGRLRVAKVELQVQSSPSVTILGAGKAVPGGGGGQAEGGQGGASGAEFALSDDPWGREGCDCEGRSLPGVEVSGPGQPSAPGVLAQGGPGGCSRQRRGGTPLGSTGQPGQREVGVQGHQRGG